MSKREISESRLTLPQVKKVLESVGEENLDQLQRRTSWLRKQIRQSDPEKAEELLKRLLKNTKLMKLKQFKS